MVMSGFDRSAVLLSAVLSALLSADEAALAAAEAAEVPPSVCLFHKNHLIDNKGRKPKRPAPC